MFDFANRKLQSHDPIKPKPSNHMDIDIDPDFLVLVLFI